MKQYYLFILLAVSLTGCDKKLRGMVSIKNTVPEYVVFAGQSNALAGNGLSLSFIQTLQIEGHLGIQIECAVGGTSITQWQKGQLLYEECLAQMRIHTPKAIIFWQGEADVNTLERTTWAVKFNAMVNNLRTDLGQQIPVIYVQLGDGPTGEMAGPNWQEMRAVQASVYNAGVYMFDATFAHKWHKMNDDGNVDVHYIPQGYTEIGKALANEYLERVK